MEMYLYYIYMPIYIYILQISPSAASPAGQERECLQEGSDSSLTCSMDQVGSCCWWVLTETKRKKMLFKKIK